MISVQLFLVEITRLFKIYVPTTMNAWVSLTGQARTVSATRAAEETVRSTCVLNDTPLQRWCLNVNKINMFTRH